MKPDALGEALRLTRQQQGDRPNNLDFHRFERINGRPHPLKKASNASPRVDSSCVAPP